MPDTTPAPSPEQIASLPTGVEICYQTFGDPDAEPLLLVMGLGGPMTWWDPKFCQMLADRGFFVIRYDNRDIGRSTWLDHEPVPNIMALVRAVRYTASRSLPQVMAR